MKDHLEALLSEVEEEEQTEQETDFPPKEHLWWKKVSGTEARRAREEQESAAPEGRAPSQGPADPSERGAAQEQAHPAAEERSAGERKVSDLAPSLAEALRHPAGQSLRVRRDARKGGEERDMVRAAGHPAAEVPADPQKSGKAAEPVWHALRRARAAADYARREHGVLSSAPLRAADRRTRSLGAAELDRLFQRDARRYDGDSPLY